MTNSKQSLGQVRVLDCTHVDAITAHRMLGQDASQQIHKILANRLDEQDEVAAQIRRARKYQTALRGKLQNPFLSQKLRAALNEYLVCLSAWADGADLANFRYYGLPGMTIDGQPVSAEDLAFALQEDEVGCQTGVYRERDGSVILWHTEEDYEQTPGERFDQLRLFSFRAAEQRIATGFIYPDLLPGPTFGWRGNDFIQAIDTLHVKPVDFEDALLPNALAWLSLYLGTQVTREELARSFGPFQGGYSLTAISKTAGKIGVEKIEFANTDHTVSQLKSDAGCYLFQTNVIADLSLPIGIQEQTSPESRAWNETRLARTAKFMKNVQKAEDALPAIFEMLRSQLGGDSAYANQDVKAYLVCRMSPAQTSIWVGSGPAVSGDDLFTLNLSNQ